MNPADRVALLERLARANAWLDLTEDGRQAHRRRAAAILDELAITDEQMKRLGWILVEMPVGDDGEDPDA